MMVQINDGFSQKARKLLEPFPMLILFYMLPKEGVEDLDLLNFPRNPLKFVADNHWLKLYSSEAFPKRLMELWAEVMWLHLDIKGFKSNYSKNDPMYILLHEPSIWIEASKVIGRDLEHLVTQGVAMKEIPYWSIEEMEFYFDILAKHFWNHPTIKGGEIYKIVKQHRAHKDYRGKSYAKIDFHRSYNHLQSGIKTISFDNQNEPILYTDTDLENIVLKDSVQSFIKSLKNEKDQIIVRLLYLGYTQAQIGKQLGYANHTPVSKRIAIIRKEYLKYYKKYDLPKPITKTINKFV